MTIEPEADVGGLLLFYNDRPSSGSASTAKRSIPCASGGSGLDASAALQRRVRLRVTNDKDIVTFRYSTDGGKSWKLVDLRMEVSGYNHNTFGGFLSLSPAPARRAAAGLRLSDFPYRGLT